MPDSNETVSQLLADSRLAFLNQQNEKALSLAKQAIRREHKNPEAYKCAGNACMSLERLDDAITNYSQAVLCDPNNGNRHYDLGYAYATNEKMAHALKSFAKAEELGCAPENLTQLYNILGIICFDIGRFDDALVNLEKAEQLVGIDLDILQRKAVIYGINSDIRNGLLTANQIKLAAPSLYIGYSIAFKLLIQAKRFDAARKELEKAKKYTSASMEHYYDCVTFELEEYKTDHNKDHFGAALAIIVEALTTAQPTVNEVVESYINAAEIYLQLEEPVIVINCLNAALNPAMSFNNGFEVVTREFIPTELSEYDIEEMIESDRVRIAEDLGDYGLEELVEGVEPDEEGSREYFTEIEDEPEAAQGSYKLDEEAAIEYSNKNLDQINRLYVGAYTLEKDFNRVIDYARKLQASEAIPSVYMGKYTEVNAMKELGQPDADQKYQELIKYFRKAMIKDPTDLLAVTFRIQCYIDMREYTEAEQLCALLAEEMREPLLEKINEAKTGGDS
ncbi:MAG: tetratricopeptide repeat protein [Coriobacteriia bacterium]|nr:tetratricopeptide repeat protein [Coriobacteriia bacterium]